MMAGIGGVDRDVGVLRGPGQNLGVVERATYRPDAKLRQRRGGLVRARQTAQLRACCHQRSGNRSADVAARTSNEDSQLGRSVQIASKSVTS